MFLTQVPIWEMIHPFLPFSVFLSFLSIRAGVERAQIPPLLENLIIPFPCGRGHGHGHGCGCGCL